MRLRIICVAGPGSTGKSTVIREFTKKYLKYLREKGDVLGIFQMPSMEYAVGVSGSGDALKFILKGKRFLSRYDGLRVAIIASRSKGNTIKEIMKIAKEADAKLEFVCTKKLRGDAVIASAIRENVQKIRRLMPA